MRLIKNVLPKAAVIYLIFTLVCGIFYTGAVTGIAQILFPYQANGSIIEVDGKKYGSALLGQQYTSDKYLWGRITKQDVTTYKDKTGKALMYAVPSNLSPASEEYGELVSERVRRIKEAHPQMEGEKIPVDLVTGSGSGLDPDISPAAAEYQAARIAEARGISIEQVKDVIEKNTGGRFLGIFGEETVNVLKVNLMLDGILEE